MKDKLLLHSCCGPCSTSVIEDLAAEYSVTSYFYNPNIYPHEEYIKRLGAQRSFCKALSIPLIEGEWNRGDWLKAVEGREKDPEGGIRCGICFAFRMEATALKALKEGCRYFATTLSVSPHKSYESVRKIGKMLEEKLKVGFVDRDFKKRDGFARSIDISKRHGLYRQRYCGCEFSLNAPQR